MADGFTVTVSGGPHLRRQLARLDEQTANRVLEGAVVAGALPIANRWKQLAAYRTGTYRRSIHIGGHTSVTPDFQTGQGYHDVGGAHHSRSEASVLIGSDVPYARRLELGYHGVDRLGRHYDQAPRAAARPAFDEKREEAQHEIEAALKAILRALTR